MMSPWPTITLPSSLTICWRPAFIRSASAMSSGEFRSTTSVIGAFMVTGSLIGYLNILCLLPSTCANLPRLQRQLGHETLELGLVLRRIHAVFQQPQRFDTPLEIPLLDDERAQLGI